MFDQPVPERRGYLRMIRPARPVWVNLALVYPSVSGLRVRLPDGLDLRAIVPGELMIWDRATTGHWVGWTMFVLTGGSGAAKVSQWVLAEALRPRRA
ncbi:hypothetical protein [Amycolatopsis cihanbeyliensis]|uniref:Uncharacterized protein n=1 Tax=Amycolatopsis cihanbeyliensis TaxID=1128664 RepID=A0A542CSF0_AMYCI|nr:hypothetical protein [Amycolatopsis cihanbeyliensis]TQI93752.1 hypothetical protein FB471_5894 [Amycolatopsis cihanbeyliensis]